MQPQMLYSSQNTEQDNKMKPKYYTILTNAVEQGVRQGVRRAFKHTDDPSLDQIEDACEKAVMEAIHEVFEFEDETYGCQ
jgi:hypothetical protein